MRKAVETTFELMNGGEQTMTDWLWTQRKDGASFRTISDRLSQRVGFPVSHEAVRQWMKV